MPTPSKPSIQKWVSIRKGYEAGKTIGHLSQEWGVSEETIAKRAAKEKWQQATTTAVGQVLERGPTSEERQRLAIEAAKREGALDVLMEYRGASVRFRKLVQGHLTEAEELFEIARSYDASAEIDAALVDASDGVKRAVNSALTHSSRIESLHRLLSAFNQCMEAEKSLVELAMAAQAAAGQPEDDVPTLSVAEYEAVQRKHAELVAKMGGPTHGTA